MSMNEDLVSRVFALATDTGTQNLVPLHLFVPSGLANGTTVTLTDSAPGEVDVWNSASPSTGDTPILGSGSGSVTWTIGSDNVPSTLYVGVEQGSASVGDIQFTLSVTPPGGSATTAKTAPATAVVLKVTLSDPSKKQVNILTSTGGLTAADLVPLVYTYEGPSQGILTISSSAAQEIEVWTTDNPTTGDTPVLGGSRHTTNAPLPSTDIVNGQLWVGASAIPKIGTISDNIQFTLKPILPASLAPVTVQSQKATAIPGQIDIFFDGTNNNGPIDAASGTDTNIYKMYKAADPNLASAIYEAGVGTGGIAGNLYTGGFMGWTCGAVEQNAMQKLTNDLNEDVGGNFTINIIGFSRGGVESLDFANQVESAIQKGNNKFTGAQVGFLGLFDPVDSIGAIRDNFGSLNIKVPVGIAHIADAVALSENRNLFDWINLIGSTNTTVVGFMGAHSDIGGGYSDVGSPIGALSNTTLHWMMNQAKAAGMEFTNIYPGLHDSYAATNIHDSWMGGSGENGGLFPLPTGPIERVLPGDLLVASSASGAYIQYGSVPASFWDPDFAGDLNYYNQLLWESGW